MTSAKKKTYYIKNYELYYLYKDYAISCYEFSYEYNILDAINMVAKNLLKTKILWANQPI